MATRVLRCFAEGRDGDWEAICLDLDIAVQGRSFEEVFGSLQEAIALYLESVAALPEDERRHLLQRAAPLSIRIRFAWQAVRSLLGGTEAEGQQHQFTMALPA